MEPTAEQKKIIQSKARVKRIIACAGSGKTSTIIQSIASLLDSGRCRAREILAITFTKNAAENMRARIRNISDSSNDFNSINIFTFNSFGNLIISENSLRLGLGGDYRLINVPKSWEILYHIVKEVHFEKIKAGKDTAAFINSLLHYIGDLKSNLISAKALRQYSSLDVRRNSLFTDYKSRALLNDEVEILDVQNELCNIYEKYEDIKKNSNMVDYNDHVFLPYHLLLQDGNLRQSYIERFKYIFVDEFQDTDVAQGYLISLLFNPDYNSLSVVGDDDQSIYSFRGACVENILNFEKWDIFKNFPVKDFYLTENFRSGSKIISAIGSVISANTGRFWKELKPGGESRHSEVFFGSFKTVSEEADSIAAMIKKLAAGGFRLKDIAVLSRKKRFREITESLEKNNLKYEVVSSKGFFYEKEVLFLISWLIVLKDIRSEQHILYLLQSEKYNISDRDIFYLKNYNAADGSFLNGREAEKNGLLNALLRSGKNSCISAGAQARIESFLKELDFYIRQASFLNLSELINLIADHSGLLDELKSDFSKSAKVKIKNIEALIRISSEFEAGGRDTDLESFVMYLRDVARTDEEDPDTAGFSGGNSVKVMSIHAAKGLEFDAVFMPMLRNSEYARRSASKKFKIPSILRKDRLIYCKKQDFTSKQKFDDEIKKINTEEERRVFYVGCSRARKLLFLSYSEYDNSREAAEGTRPSEILSFAQDLREAEGLEIADFSDLEKIERFFAVGSDSGYGRNGKNGSNRSADNAVNDFYGSIIPVSRAFNRIAGRYAEGRKHEIAAIEKIIKKPAPSGKKQQPGRKIFSLSEILSYLNCPSGYLWRYVYNIPEPQSEDAEIGLKVHEHIKTITELCFKSGTPGEEINKITENYLEKLSLKENSSRYIEYIKLFCSSSALSFSDVLRLYTEQLIYWYLDGNAISCKIDRLDVKKDGTLQIMDYKTSSSGAHKNEAAYDGNYMNQLAAYTGACMDVFNKNAGYISSALFYLKDGKTERKAFKDNEISVIKNKISAAIKDINSGRFKIKGPKCGSRCHFYSICDCV